MRQSLSLLAAAVASCLVTHSSMAASLSGNLTADNEFRAYISTSDSTPGTPVANGSDWATTYTFTNVGPLTAGQTYFLHIEATNWGGPAGLVGSFQLSGSSFQFQNGTQSLDTNTAHWRVSNTTWGNYTDTVQSFGANGASPWGPRSNIANTAQWIWGTEADNNTRYFSTTIRYVDTGSPVPTPAAAGAGAMLLGGMALRRRRNSVA